MKNLLFPQRDEDDGETFYESYQTPHPRPAPRPTLPPSVKSPASAVSPSYPASEYSDWDTETTGSEAEADKTPTHRHKEASLTLEELQEAAKRLNLSLVTSPAHIPAPDPAPASIPDLQPAPAPAPAPTAPPRQKSDLCAEDLKGNVADDPSLLATNPCMAAPAPSCPSLPLINTDPGCPSDPDIVDQDTIEDPEPVPDNPETDDVSTNEDDTSLSDESECTTVMFLDKKNVVGKTEMRFRDIYDDVVAVDEVQSPQEIASGRLSDYKDTIVKNAPTIEENLKQAMEMNSEQVETETYEEFEAVKVNTEEAQAREASPKSLIRVEESSTHPRAMSESTETLRTEEAGAKPRSYKKVKAPQPPGPGSQSSLVTPAETILHLSPVRDTDTEVSQEQPEPEQGRVLYKSRGYDEEVYEKTRPVKINIKQDSLESQMLGEGETMGPKSQVSEPVVSNTFIKNQDFLQPLIKERDAPPSNRSSGSWSHAGQPEESRPAPPPPPPPIRETYPFTSAAPTRLFTYNPSSGAIGLRKYDVAEDGESYGRLPRPASPLASRYTSSSSRPGSPALADLGRASSPLEAGESSLGRCPHCTIHSWLPHSPGCLNRNRK